MEATAAAALDSNPDIYFLGLSATGRTGLGALYDAGVSARSGAYYAGEAASAFGSDVRAADDVAAYLLTFFHCLFPSADAQSNLRYAADAALRHGVASGKAGLRP